MSRKRKFVGGVVKQIGVGLDQEMYEQLLAMQADMFAQKIEVEVQALIRTAIRDLLKNRFVVIEEAIGPTKEVA